MTAFRRVVITGSAGNLGAKLSQHLANRFEIVPIDRAEGDLSEWNENWVRLFAGADAVFLLVGDPVAYHPWEELVKPNVDAMLNVYEAAAQHRVKRVIFASSNHVMGGYQDIPEVKITTEIPPKPGTKYFADGAPRFSGRYAATKLFGERVGRMYAKARGLAVICVRLGWIRRTDNVPDRLPLEYGEWFRKMWLSDRDFLRLMTCCLSEELTDDFLIVNGMSRNRGMRWDIDATSRSLKYEPLDDVEQARD